jgi:hypothetical protein
MLGNARKKTAKKTRTDVVLHIMITWGSFYIKKKALRLVTAVALLGAGVVGR